MVWIDYMNWYYFYVPGRLQSDVVEGTQRQSESLAVPPTWLHIDVGLLTSACKSILHIQKHDFNVHRCFEVLGQLLCPLAAIQALIRVPAHLQSIYISEDQHTA